jgi:hypothetical protein
MAKTPDPDASAERVDLPDLPTLFVTRLNARTFCYKLLVVIGFLLAAHVVTALLYWPAREAGTKPEWFHFYMIGMWDLDVEESFGTYYSGLVLLLIGRLLWFHGRNVQRSGDWLCWWWLVLSLGFHWLSLDEIVALHEILNEYHKEGLPLGASDRWTTQGFIAAVTVALLFLPFLWRLRWCTAIWFAVGGLIYVGGALGVEKATDWFEVDNEMNTLRYNLWTAVEEGLEMIGPVVFLHALLAHITGRSRGTLTTATKIETMKVVG